ncbi:MAG: response regulator [Elusimicrobiales bacterium]|jgi:DNA-binding response OmpR family regulator
MPQPDIVIIEDDPLVGEISCGLLTDAGYAVLLIQDSYEALSVIRTSMPKLILADIMLPGISGMDICKTVKSDPALKHIKVIVMSGKSFAVERQRALRFGADLFLLKPYDVETFLKTVKSVMDGPAS